MAFYKTSNPTLRQNTFARAGELGPTMTLNGTVHKTGILLLLAMVSAAWTWRIVATQGADAAAPWMIGGIFGGFIVSLVAIFAKRSTPVTAPIYAVLEGFALGGISSVLDQQYRNIAIQAVVITFGALLTMLALYATGAIRATPGFVRFVVVATGTVCLVYVIDMVLHWFGIGVPFINSAGGLGIGFSIFVVILATLNLVLDFAMIEQGAQEGAPKYMEWYGAFAIMVTLVWLYLEVLRLLAKTRQR